MNTQEWIDYYRKEADKASGMADRIEAILKLFPDTVVNKDRFGTIRIEAKSCAKLCDKVELRHSCGCCGDSALLARPFMETAYGRIYCSGIGIGEKYYNGGDIPWKGWQEKIKAEGVPSVIVEKIEQHFHDCREARRKEIENEPYEIDLEE
jgi:hypothetical protein